MIRHVPNVTKLAHHLLTVLRKAPLNLFGRQNATAFPMAIARTIIDLHVVVVLKPGRMVVYVGILPRAIT